jgi:hypothetical protein
LFLLHSALHFFVCFQDPQKRPTAAQILDMPELLPTVTEKLQNELKEKDAVIAKQSEELAQKDEALAGKDQQIEKLEKENAAQSKRIAELEAQLKPKDRALAATPTMPGVDLPISFVFLLLFALQIPPAAFQLTKPEVFKVEGTKITQSTGVLWETVVVQPSVDRVCVHSSLPFTLTLLRASGSCLSDLISSSHPPQPRPNQQFQRARRFLLPPLFPPHPRRMLLSDRPRPERCNRRQQ